VWTYTIEVPAISRHEGICCDCGARRSFPANGGALDCSPPKTTMTSSGS
jgi:hypothetical protein